MFDFSIIERMFFDSESSGEVGRVDFLTVMICTVTHLIDATASRVHFSGRDCTRREGKIMDSIATIRDGPSMLKIVLYVSANSEPDFSPILLLPPIGDSPAHGIHS